MTAPANDDLANAEEITTTAGSVGPVTIDDATSEGSEIGTPHQTIWYFFLASTSATGVHLTTEGSVAGDVGSGDGVTPPNPFGSLDTNIRVYEVTTATPTYATLFGNQITFNEDVSGTVWWSDVTFDTVAGRYYFFRVGTFDEGYTGTVTVNWSGVPVGAVSPLPFTPTVVDADVQHFNTTTAAPIDPVVSYQADDWVVFLGIINGNSPTGVPTDITLTSSGGNSLQFTYSIQTVNQRFVIGWVRATASGSSTWTVNTSGNVSYWWQRGAVVIRDVPPEYDFVALDPEFLSRAQFYDNTSGPLSSAVTLTDPVGHIAIMDGTIRDDSDDSVITFVSVSPQDIVDNDWVIVIPDEFAFHDSFNMSSWVAVDLGLNLTTTTYEALHTATDADTIFDQHLIDVIERFVVWPITFTTAEVLAYWGILAVPL